MFTHAGYEKYCIPTRLDGVVGEQVIRVCVENFENHEIPFHRLALDNSLQINVILHPE